MPPQVHIAVGGDFYPLSLIPLREAAADRTSKTRARETAGLCALVSGSSIHHVQVPFCPPGFVPVVGLCAGLARPVRTAANRRGGPDRRKLCGDPARGRIQGHAAPLRPLGGGPRLGGGTEPAQPAG